jgi:YfiH family protein
MVKTNAHVLNDGHITVPGFAPTAEHFFGTKAQRVNPTVGVVTAVATKSAAQRVSGIITVKQVHGTDALVVDRPPDVGMRFDGGWDAVVTDQPGVLVSVRTADCVPVLLHDPTRRVVAAVHAGWRGAVAGIVPRTIDLLRTRFGSNAADIMAAVGPSVGMCCYEVDEPVMSRVQGYAFWPKVVRHTKPGKAMLDLRRFVQEQTAAAGIDDTRLFLVDLCTVCHPSLFYSYRRDGIVSGTMVSGIALNPPTA